MILLESEKLRLTRRFDWEYVSKLYINRLSMSNSSVTHGP